MYNLKKILKNDLTKTSMAKKQAVLYELESALYSVAGKRDWSHEFLTAEILAIKSRANQAENFVRDISSFLGNLSGLDPWDLQMRRLNTLSKEFPTHQCFSEIGLRGFQSQISQARFHIKSTHVIGQFANLKPLQAMWNRKASQSMHSNDS